LVVGWDVAGTFELVDAAVAAEQLELAVPVQSALALVRVAAPVLLVGRAAACRQQEIAIVGITIHWFGWQLRFCRWVGQQLVIIITIKIAIVSIITIKIAIVGITVKVAIVGITVKIAIHWHQ
jgi:hypothetical protein